MNTSDYKNNLEEPFTFYGRYTYADNLTSDIEGMVELINGKVFRQVAALRMKHQNISLTISEKLYKFLKGKKWKGFSALLMFGCPSKSRH